jgi:hypothetical protein
MCQNRTPPSEIALMRFVITNKLCKLHCGSQNSLAGLRRHDFNRAD